MHDTIRQYLRAQPFVPFRVYRATGVNWLIWHPDYAFVAPDNRTFLVYERDKSVHFLEVSDVTRLEFEPDPTPLLVDPPA